MNFCPYIEFDVHEGDLQHGGIQFVRDIRDAGRRAIEAASGRRARNILIRSHGSVHNVYTFSVVNR